MGCKEWPGPRRYRAGDGHRLFIYSEACGVIEAKRVSANLEKTWYL